MPPEALPIACLLSIVSQMLKSAIRPPLEGEQPVVTTKSYGIISNLW